jgi:hypothetical protein
LIDLVFTHRAPHSRIHISRRQPVRANH